MDDLRPVLALSRLDLAGKGLAIEQVRRENGLDSLMRLAGLPLQGFCRVMVLQLRRVR